jgi:hypothetical protein
MGVVMRAIDVIGLPAAQATANRVHIPLPGENVKRLEFLP